MSADPLTWSRVPAPIRALARWATIVNAAGYAIALALVCTTTGLTPAGAASRYRGTDPAADTVATAPMQFPKPLGEMLLSTHTHLLGMSALFIVSGLCFALCAWPSGIWKRLLIVEPFIATLVSFGALWLMRYADPRFGWLLFASSVSMAAVFALQTVVILRELARAGTMSAGDGR